MDLNKKSNEKDDFISLTEFFEILLDYKKTLVTIVISFAFLSVVYSLSLPNKYTSTVSLEIKLGESSNSSSGSMGGIPSLIGMNGGNKKSAMLKSMMLSKSFAKNLIQYEGISESIIASKSFNINTGEIYFDDDIFDSKTKKWTRNVSYPFKTKPSYLEIHQEYSGSLKILIDDSSGLMEISFQHISPIFSKYFIDLIVIEANKFMKSKDNEESKNALNYLNKEISKSSQLEIRKAIGSLVETQLKKQMVSDISDEYALSTINESFVPEIKSSPNRAFICVIGTFIGLFMSILVAMIHHFLIRTTN